MIISIENYLMIEDSFFLKMGNLLKGRFLLEEGAVIQNICSGECGKTIFYSKARRIKNMQEGIVKNFTVC